MTIQNSINNTLATTSLTGLLQAANFPALTGDVTNTGGSLSTTVASNAITYAKFQQVAASSLVGNPTGSTANAQGITIGATLTFSGTALQTVALTGDITTSANSFATTLATVNSNVGTFTNMTATVNAKGLITAASNGTATTYFTYNDQTTASVTMAADNAYLIDDGATLVTATLPGTAARFAKFKIVGFSAGGWKIAQATGQTIHFGNLNTTAGTGGSLASTNQYDSIELICTAANTDFVVVNAQGNITIV